jgi:hypothetical protein
MTLVNMRELIFPHARYFSQKPEGCPINDKRDARTVVNRNIADRH